MFPVSEKTRSLREVLLADVAPVRPDARVREHVLIKVARGEESSLAQYTRRDLRFAVFKAFVTLQFPTSHALFTALLALKPLLVKHQMTVQPAPVMEHLAAQVTRVLILGIPVSTLMPPLVCLDILHFFPAVPTDLQLRGVSPFHVVSQVGLQLVTPPTMLADVP